MNSIINTVPGNNAGVIPAINLSSLSVSTATTSSADSKVVMTAPLRLVGAVIFALFIIPSVTLNSLLLIVYSKGNTKFKRSAPVFYAIAWQCLLADFQALIPQVFVVLPETFAGRQLYPDWLVYFLGCFDTYGYQAAFLFVLLLTLNRFCIFFFPKVDRLLFHRARIFIWTTSIWVIVVLMTTFWNVEGCYKTFDTRGFYLYATDSCSAPVNISDPSTYPNVTGTAADPFLAALSAFLFNTSSNILGGVPELMIGLYAIIYIKIRISTTRLANSKHERRFLLQSFVICLVYMVEFITFDAVPLLPLPGQWGFVANFVTDYIVIVCETVHAIVIFSFNATARSVLMEEVLPKWVTKNGRGKVMNGITAAGALQLTTTTLAMIRVE